MHLEADISKLKNVMMDSKTSLDSGLEKLFYGSENLIKL